MNIAKSETLSETREQFEAKFVGNNFQRESEATGIYWSGLVQAAWEGWQDGIEAGRLQGLEEAAKIAEEFCGEGNNPAAAIREKMKGHGKS
jgi:hypothetical protein